ncbi:hypothetical protein HELRODRAFT_79183, partial [Helobdella robusta]|uniref:DNA topoisomerase I n=1 Tax=Helobdella robusta TaxID=6412 RepID=T1G3L2_HELRO
WKEKRKNENIKWRTLEHKGPCFAPPYQCLPRNVRFYYDKIATKLSLEAEEAAGFYAALQNSRKTSATFDRNFFADWKSTMRNNERCLIRNFNKCNFKELENHFKRISDAKKQKTREEKQALKKANEKLQKTYGYCVVDGHKQKIGNFRVEPPGLFVGRGDHPKQGMLKRRVQPEDVTINCSLGPKIPKPPTGHKWKEVMNNNTVTWLACWTENIFRTKKYIMLNPASKLKSQKDWQKYETSRKLHKCLDDIRSNYKKDFKSNEMCFRQRAVALYFIDQLALRVGNEKDKETADTVGCCSLRVEHVKLHNTLNGKRNVVEFDFLGKDCIRYTNRVPVIKMVFDNLKLFMRKKCHGSELFDCLDANMLNKHLQSIMDGLTAKVFRTFHASRTLQEKLDLLTVEKDSLHAKLFKYNKANRDAALLCNHQRAVPKNFEKQIENLRSKVIISQAFSVSILNEISYQHSILVMKKEATCNKLKEHVTKLQLQLKDKLENREIALGTSKLNYLDPRISVAWLCKRWQVPIGKIYNKSLQERFAWAIDTTKANFHY